MQVGRMWDSVVGGGGATDETCQQASGAGRGRLEAPFPAAPSLLLLGKAPENSNEAAQERLKKGSG